MDWLDIMPMILGWIILVLVCCYSIPQLITVVKTKNTKGLSLLGLIFFVVSSASMLVWGIGNAFRGIYEQGMPMWNVILILLPNVVMNTLNTTINVTSLVLKIKHLVKAKKLGIDEIQLSKILLKQQKEKMKSRKVGK